MTEYPKPGTQRCSGGWPGPEQRWPSGSSCWAESSESPAREWGAAIIGPAAMGEWFPPLDLPTMIEIGHRWAAALVSLVVLAVAAVAWVRHRDEPSSEDPATLASFCWWCRCCWAQ